MLFFLFGIFGVPKSLSGDGLLTALTDHIHLGLDLKGGTHLILQVQVSDAVNVDAQNAIEVLKEQLRTRKIDYSDITQSDPQNNPDHLVLKGIQPSARGDLLGVVRDRLPEYDINGGAENTWIMAMKPSMLTDLKNKAVTQAIDTIRNRIDALGVSEPTIQEHGLGQYRDSRPVAGHRRSGTREGLMQSTAMLEIKQMTGGPYQSEQAALQDKGGMMPADSMLLSGQCANGPEPTWCFVSRTSAVSGKDLRSADPTTDQNGQPAVHFNLSGEGGQRSIPSRPITWATVSRWCSTTRCRKSRTWNQSATRARSVAAGSTSSSEGPVDDSASGALPASIKYMEERTVGPSLGADSIRSGVRAAVIGMVAVLIFMLIYYRGAGINADVALIMNLIILLGFLGWSTIAGVNVALTLPGIAGVILTVGMGVDSNVLIFERIREELRNGKTPPSAVDQGFSHAWITIVDTHVTDHRVGRNFVRLRYRTGEGIRDYPDVRIAGQLVFTAVFVSRVIFDWVLSRKQRGDALSI